MPYIKKAQRSPIDKFLDGLIVILVNTTSKGKVNNGQTVYTIYKLLRQIYGEGNFETKSNALKVLESAKLEYYRRVMAPYEDSKIASNGDVK